MTNLTVKEVQFNNATLMAVQNKGTSKIHVGVSFICNGIGLSKSQKDTQVQNIQSDIVLKQGCLKFQAGVFDPNNEALGIELDFLPLWLAKISITPKMQEEQPELTEKLVDYQLRAKDVLAEAFITKTRSTRTKPIDIIFRQRFNMAKTLVEHIGIKPGIAYALAINETEKETGESLELYKKLLPPAEHEVGFLNATEIGKRTGAGAREINQVLLGLGLQYKDDKKRWRLTEEGFKYGEEMPFVRNGHSDYQIRWNESVLDVLQGKTG